MKTWKTVAISSGIWLGALVVYFVLSWTLPKYKAQIQPIKQEFEIQKLQKEFNVEDLRDAVKSASEILQRLEKSNIKETIPELFMLGQQFKKTMESWAGSSTGKESYEDTKRKH